MTENEAIEIIEEYKGLFPNARNESESLDIAITALEKQIPKKPMISYDERVKENWFSCGVCAFGFGWKRTVHYKYCPDCGHAIDWS